MANARIVNTPAQALPQNGTSHQVITVSNTSNDLQTLGSFTLNASSTHVLVQINTAAIRVTFDGSDATSSKGFRYVPGTIAYWPRDMFLAANCIAESSTDATLDVQELNYR